jgi:hypothetical protein
MDKIKIERENKKPIYRFKVDDKLFESKKNVKKYIGELRNG